MTLSPYQFLGGIKTCWAVVILENDIPWETVRCYLNFRGSMLPWNRCMPALWESRLVSILKVNFETTSWSTIRGQVALVSDQIKDRSRANLTIWQTQVLINMILHLMVCILSRYQHLARALTMNLHLGEIDTSHIWYKSKTLSKDRMLHTSDFLAIRVVSIADSAFAIFGLGPQDTVAASRHALSLHANVRRAGFTSKHTQKVKC